MPGTTAGNCPLSRRGWVGYTDGMRHLKPLLIFALCLTLFAASVTQAVARGQMAGGQMVQLCAGGEAVTVMMDAQGNPVDRQHPCPDCISVTAVLPSVDIAPAFPMGRNMRLPLPISGLLHAQTQLGACARGPPVLI